MGNGHIVIWSVEGKNLGLQETISTCVKNVLNGGYIWNKTEIKLK